MIVTLKRPVQEGVGPFAHVDESFKIKCEKRTETGGYAFKPDQLRLAGAYGAKSYANSEGLTVVNPTYVVEH